MAEVSIEFSLVHGDLVARLERRVGIAPRGGWGMAPRALILASLTWLPIAVDLWVSGDVGTLPEWLMRHLPVHVRCLVALPLFIACDGSADFISRQFFTHLRRSELVGPARLPALRALVQSASRMRDSWLPWSLIGALGLVWAVRGTDSDEIHELMRTEAGQARVAFAAAWYMYVARPLFAVLLLGWLWRLFLWTWVMTKVARLPLSLVPSHPDRACGLGVLERMPAAFAPLVLGVASVVAAEWGHNVAYHGVQLASLRAPLAIFAAIVCVLMLAPVCVFAPMLARTRIAALLEYGALVARHGQLVRDRWILGREIGEPQLLHAPELGPVADMVSLFAAVARTRVIPAGKTTLAWIAAPLALPIFVLVAFRLPLAPLVTKIVRTLL